MLILAHRGASGYAPENTWAAFELAHQMGANGIETDVQVSRDGVLILIHDPRVDRTTDGSGAVAELRWSELERLDAGRWMGEQWAGQRIVRLGDFLDWCFPASEVASRALSPAARHGPGDTMGEGAARRGAADGWPGGLAGKGARADDSPKPDSEKTGVSGAGLPQDNLGFTICLEVKAPAAAAPLTSALAARGLTDRTNLQITSFDWETVLRLRAGLPGLLSGFLTPRFDSAEIVRVAEAKLGQICPRADVLTAELVGEAHAHGLEVRAWGVRTRDDLARVFATGADGTTLNWPDWAAELASGTTIQATPGERAARASDRRLPPHLPAPPSPLGPDDANPPRTGPGAPM
ncbi:MAG: hypothetical protein IT305_25735 [Chloroflexi bacterium]|nr:hypothetical protein [Chloroflexota bacterium]